MKNKALRKLLKNPTAIISLTILFVIITACLFCEVLAPYGFDEQSLMDRLQPPSAQHIFGTDEYGRDVFSRVLYGGQNSIVIGFAAVFLCMIIGGTLGMLAGYYKKAEAIIMRLIDIQIAIPGILFCIVIAATLGDSMINVVFSVAIFSIPTMTRMIRAEVLSLKNSEFVLAARTYGLPGWRIILVHILPNILHTMIVLATMRFASSVLTSATLSFLGLGVKPPMADWGSMINNGRLYIRSAWWLILAPGAALLLLTLAVNLLGDALRDALDPKVQ
ncbi:MAG: ABC transporter permease [Oscillospiraceae bacterium]|nr:ABC transporter permease [Oscillospiraceae bacterium]